MNSDEILQALDKIAAHPGKKDKLALLTEYMVDHAFFRTVVAACDPQMTFGQRPSRTAGSGSRYFAEDTWDMLSALASRRLTGTAAVVAIQEAMVAMTPASAELLWRVINKDLRAGFGESSINKVKPGTIIDPPYMRCSLPKHVDFSTWNWAAGVISQEKADGMFVNLNVEGVATMSTRQGTLIPYEGFEQLHDIAAGLLTGTQVHGEMLVMKDGAVLAREVGNGMINSVMQGGVWPEGCAPVLRVWDQIALSAAKPKGRYNIPYLIRLKGLTDQLLRINSPLIRPVQTKIVRSLRAAYIHCQELLKQGKEGTIVKNPEGVWGDYTSKDQIKLKLEVTVELEVVGFEEGKEGKKTAATFGSLICRSSDGNLEVSVSGMSDALRKQIHEHRDEWLGSIITVMANGILYSTQPGKKPHSLFLPRFVEARPDKKVADTIEQIEDQFSNAIDKLLLELDKAA